MSADTLLGRLEVVHPRGNGNWICRCPAHDDRGPSLSIRETEDGTVLLKCFAGCTAHEVCEAAGIELRDLFPPAPPNGHAIRRPRRIPPIPCWDMVRALSYSLSVVLLASEQLARGEPLLPEDHETLVSAIATVERTISEVRNV